jgi:cytochrome c oxidase subunit IV
MRIDSRSPEGVASRNRDHTGGATLAERQPAILTFRPDNMLTVGLMFAIMYVAAVFAVQGLMRWGLVPSVAGSNAPRQGTVAA